MLSFDHLVIASKHIEQDSKRFGNLHDVETIEGGKHKIWGTANFLSYYTNHCYIEWLGVQNDQIAKQSKNPLIQHLVNHVQNGFFEAFQFALQTDNIEHYLTHFGKIDQPFVGPIKGQRHKPDGTRLTWRMLFPIYDIALETLPFLIAWDQPENERIDPNLINDTTIDTLYFGGTTLEKFTEIYNISPDNIEQNTVKLANLTIMFSNEQKITFTMR